MEREDAVPCRVALVVNPHAGSGSGAEVGRAAAAVLRRHASVELLSTEAAGHAATLATEAARGGATVVAAVGGDGTLHEVANGLYAAGMPGDVALGVVPVGSGNDYAKMIGVHGLGPEAAAEVLLQGRRRPVDVGVLAGFREPGEEAGTEVFINNMALGFTAAATAGFESSRFLPGRLAYLFGGARAFLGFRPELVSLVLDGHRRLEGTAFLCHVGIGRYCGAGVCLTRDAEIDDGWFDLCVALGLSKCEALLAWPKLARGEHPGGDRVALVRAKRVEIEGPRGFLFHVEGELRRAVTGVLRITLEPGGLHVLGAS